MTKITGIYIYSCYSPSSATVPQYSDVGFGCKKLRHKIMVRDLTGLDGLLTPLIVFWLLWRQIWSSIFQTTDLGLIVNLTYVETILPRRMVWCFSGHCSNHQIIYSNHQIFFFQIENGPCADVGSRGRAAGNQAQSRKPVEGNEFQTCCWQVTILVV